MFIGVFEPGPLLELLGDFLECDDIPSILSVSTRVLTAFSNSRIFWWYCTWIEVLRGPANRLGWTPPSTP